VAGEGPVNWKGSRNLELIKGERPLKQLKIHLMKKRLTETEWTDGSLYKNIHIKPASKLCATRNRLNKIQQQKGRRRKKERGPLQGGLGPQSLECRGERVGHGPRQNKSCGKGMLCLGKLAAKSGGPQKERRKKRWGSFHWGARQSRKRNPKDVITKKENLRDPIKGKGILQCATMGPAIAGAKNKVGGSGNKYMESAV